jgi:hypothetical protein
MSEETTASGLIVDRAAPKPLEVHKSFGSLKGEILTQMPLRAREPDLTPSEVKARSGEVRTLLERMRILAYRDKHVGQLNEVHTLVFELQLALGEWKAGGQYSGRIHLPGER